MAELEKPFVDRDRPLSERERELIQRLFRWEELPQALKAAITDHVSVNGSLHVSSMPTLKGEEWREVGATGQPGFENNWVNHAGGFETAAFYKDALGIVHIRGLVKSGTIGTRIFTLPAGYRPVLSKIFSTDSSSGASTHSRVDVATDGAVTPVVGATGYFSIEGISFRADA